jgi:YD repeat-containing protein
VKAFVLDLEFEQGATYRETFTWKAGKPAMPVNLTGCTAWARFRVTDPPSVKRDQVLELTTEDGRIELGDLDGTITLIVPDTVTQTFAWDKAAYQVYVRHPDGSVTRLLEGVAEVSHSV